MSRRRFLYGSTLAAATAASLPVAKAAATRTPAGVPGENYKIQNGRIRHSVMGWCFNPMPTGELMAGCHRMGMTAMEGIERKFYPELRKLGMKPSLISSHGFKDGPSSRDNHAACLAKLREAIDVAVEFGAPGVITFTGMRVKDLSDEQMAKNCVNGWKQVI